MLCVALHFFLLIVIFLNVWSAYSPGVGVAGLHLILYCILENCFIGRRIRQRLNSDTTITREPENIVVQFLRRINIGFWETIMSAHSTHHSLPVDYEVISEAVRQNSAVHMKEQKLHHQTVHKSGRLPKEKAKWLWV